MYAYMGKEITIFPEDYLVGRTNLLTISTTYGYVQSLNKLADLKRHSCTNYDNCSFHQQMYLSPMLLYSQ